MTSSCKTKQNKFLSIFMGHVVYLQSVYPPGRIGARGLQTSARAQHQRPGWEGRLVIGKWGIRTLVSDVTMNMPRGKGLCCNAGSYFPLMITRTTTWYEIDGNITLRYPWHKISQPFYLLLVVTDALVPHRRQGVISNIRREQHPYSFNYWVLRQTHRPLSTKKDVVLRV